MLLLLGHRESVQRITVAVSPPSVKCGYHVHGTACKLVFMKSGSVNQPVTVVLPQGPLAGLLAGADYALTDWYATPLSAKAAGFLLSATQRAIQLQLRSGVSSGPLQVLLQICRFWQEEPRGSPAMSWQQPAQSAREAALQELVHGQLLASRKLHPALTHLARGFRHAAPLLETADYFRLLREHELLAGLPFSDTPVAAADLPALLHEAAVTRRLQHGDRRPPPWPHLDTPA